MRTVRFQAVLFGIGHLLGIDVSQDINRDHAAGWTSFINSRVREGWEAWPFPELNLTEERAFRQVWYSDTPYFRADAAANNKPSELYYLPNTTYYQVNATAPADPPLGTLPTNATYFTPIDLTTMEKYIAYDQPGKQSIGMVYGTYAGDPRITRRPRRWDHFPSDNGIEIYRGAGPTVWLHYQVRPSEFTSGMYDPAASYARGDLAYDPVSGEVFRALIPNTNQPVSETNVWLKQPMPYLLAEYVKFGAAGDAIANLKSKGMFESKALTALSREIDKLMEQGGQFPKYRMGRLGRRRLCAPTAIVTVPAV